MPLPSLTFWNRTPPATIFVPAERFFVRVVTLTPGIDAEQQVELALEGLAPFPLPQLFWGFLLAPDRGSALVYAAHRRRFPADEVKSWQQAALVVPSFLPLAGKPATLPAVTVHNAGTQLAGAAWRNAVDALPAAVMVRGYAAEPTPEERQTFVRELATRAGLPGTGARFLTGAPDVAMGRDGLQFRLAGGPAAAATLVVRKDQLDHLDVRDREFLAERRNLQRRGTILWRTLLAGAAAVVFAVLLDVGALALHVRSGSVLARIAAQKPTVDRLETEHTLATRVDELASQRLLPFEMLVVLNDKRPASVQFLRTTTQGSDTLEIEAQTANAGDVTVFEQALHETAGITQVKTRDIRARDGLTSFVITVVFKTEALRAANKSPA